MPSVSVTGGQFSAKVAYYTNYFALFNGVANNVKAGSTLTLSGFGTSSNKRLNLIVYAEYI